MYGNLGKTKVNLIITIVMVLSNLLFSLLLLKWIGYLGPAIATVVSNYIAVALYLFIGINLLKCSMWTLLPLSNLASIGIVSFVAGTAGTVIVNELDQPGARLITACVVYTIVFMILAVLFNIFQPDDRRMMRKILSKIPGLKYLKP